MRPMNLRRHISRYLCREMTDPTADAYGHWECGYFGGGVDIIMTRLLPLLLVLLLLGAAVGAPVAVASGLAGFLAVHLLAFLAVGLPPLLAQPPLHRVRLVLVYICF